MRGLATPLAVLSLEYGPRGMDPRGRFPLGQVVGTRGSTDAFSLQRKEKAVKLVVLAVLLSLVVGGSVVADGRTNRDELRPPPLLFQYEAMMEGVGCLRGAKLMEYSAPAGWLAIVRIHRCMGRFDTVSEGAMNDFSDNTTTLVAELNTIVYDLTECEINGSTCPQISPEQTKEVVDSLGTTLLDWRCSPETARQWLGPSDWCAYRTPETR